MLLVAALALIGSSMGKDRVGNAAKNLGKWMQSPVMRPRMRSEVTNAARTFHGVVMNTPMTDSEEEKKENVFEDERFGDAVSRFAPWMEGEAKELEENKRKQKEFRAKQQKAFKDLQSDPQAAEVGAAGGVNSKVLSQEEVELRWETDNEVGNVGFLVQRRRGGKDNFETIATYENFAPLRSKGPGGGLYVYLDDTADVGTWVYRIVDCDKEGELSAVGQKLVEVESQSEQTFTLVLGGLIATLAIALFCAGSLFDPIQTTDKGSSFF